MSEADQSRLQAAADAMLDNLDKRILKAMQRDAYLCSAECLSSKHSHSSSSQFSQQCVQRCQIPTQQANNVVQQEMGSFQNRLQRSIMACQDEANDQVTQNMDQKKIDRLQTQMEKCGRKAIDSHISLLSTIEKKMAEQLRGLSKN